MSLPAPSPLNSNFTLIQNTKISASPNMKSSLKKNKKKKAATLDYLHQSKNHDEADARTAVSLHPSQITFHFSSSLRRGRVQLWVQVVLGTPVERRAK